MHRLLISLFAGFAGLMITASVPAAEKVDYLTQIKPLLAKHCISCHGSLNQESGLRLDAAKFIRKGGEGGAAIVVGKSDESLLIEAVTGDDDFRMPLEGKPLKAEEIALLVKWINQGALAPTDEPIAADPSEHWAFNGPVRPDIPRPKNAGWVRNPIDAFLAVEHERKGLAPQSDAPKHILLRRVYLDLIGLPPKPDQLRDFLADSSPDAYQRVVDRLLESPRYGERWGRHWMDVWRYSDWYGYKAALRSSARHIWRWRDWIVESVNDDAPYNQMIVDMLAADEVAPGDLNRLRATGFLARNYYVFNRNVWLDSTIEHTSKAFLGLTMNCARCHDHKYDPISQNDYYSFRAFFEPHKTRTRRLPGRPNINKDGLAFAFDAELNAKTYLFKRGNEKLPDKEHPLSPALPELLAPNVLKIHPVQIPEDVYYPGLRSYIRREMLAAAATQIKNKQRKLTSAQATVTSSQKKLATLRKQQADALALARESQQKPPTDAKTATSKPKPFLADDFSRPRPETWHLTDGMWDYKDGILIQQEIVKEIRSLSTVSNHPRDLTATFHFKILGGTTYHSVGMSFDYQNGSESDSVFLSAHSSESKVQVSHKRGGVDVYPKNGRRRIPLSVGKEYTLRLDIRDQLLNVTVDGVLQLVYKLPHKRRNGGIALWTYDARSEFLNCRVEPLPDDFQMAETLAAGKDEQERLKTREQAEQAVQDATAGVTVARQSLVAARVRLTAVEARIAADDARYTKPPIPDAAKLAFAAALADRNEMFYRAVADVGFAKLTYARSERAAMNKDAKKVKAATADKKKLDKAEKKLTDARESIEHINANYKPLTKVYPKTSTGRRLALARWIADSKNPLTPRVAVNHIWMRHFGAPLVPTVFDFGLNGKPATHPELLDWLAVEFIESGWSMKHLHRLMVTSSVYRMHSSSQLSHENNNATIDPDNRLLWRMNPRRMEAEVVRDSVLWLTGQLNSTMGGADIDSAQGETNYRRSIYFRHAPEKMMPFLEMFDAASTYECYRRNETVVPQQALAMINSRLSIEQARHLATRLNAQIGDGADEDAFIDALFQQVLCRPPLKQERETCRHFLAEQTARFVDLKKLTAFDSGAKLKVKPATKPNLRARENLAHVLLNHNEFVTAR